MSENLLLLDLLSDGRFHSGRELGAALGVAPTTVWKRIRSLEAMGLDIYGVRGRGYRLAAPLERLDADGIRGLMDAESRGRLAHLEVLPQVDSTNAWLSAHAAQLPSGSACIAEQQTAGRGRRGRPWQSPFGRNLYLSLLWHLPSRSISGLSLAVGVTVAEACESLGARGIALKWPNDLVCPRGKLGGILIELATALEDTTVAVIGIGLNVDMPAALRAGVDQPVSDLNEVSEATVSRNRLAAVVLERLSAALPRFALQGLGPFRASFASRDASLGRTVTVEEGGRVRSGRVQGIDEDGALMLETPEGLTRVQNGDVTLRAQP